MGYAIIGFGKIGHAFAKACSLLVQARGNSWGRLVFKDLVQFD
jgi:hypothetical protein